LTRIKVARRRSAYDPDMTPSRYATRTVPRYTSYPTAPHFGADIGPDDYVAWLAGLDAAAPVSLYLHVPYCRAICHYCGCHTKAALRDDPLLDYAESLLAEIALVADRIGRRLPVSHVHWGGGTPGLMPSAPMRAIVAALRDRFAFRDDLEHAIELDPRTVDATLVETLAAVGVSRASLGVQDFDPDVQRAMGRIQPVDTVARAVELLAGVGLTALNFDLMYGLPRQTPATVAATVAEALRFAPARIALFGYAHVPWFKKNQRLIDETLLPGAEARLELEATARAALAAAGYVAIGLDHFARPDDEMAIAAAAGRLGRNFQGYTTDTAGALIGLGASSIGRLPQGFVQNAPDIGGWARAIADGHPATVKGIALHPDDRLRGAVIERLMCDERVDLAAVCAAHGARLDVFDAELAALDDLAADGLVDRDGARVTVTEAGRPYVRVVAAVFDAYLDRGAARHSVAV
jgi:oxygen-independent coproporphyrinogen-3 oxidase